MVRKGRNSQDRKLRRKSEVPKCHIFCEGDMEKEYLNILDDKVVKIIIDSKNSNSTDPNAIYDEAKAFIRTRKFTSAVDKCIIIVDTDRLNSRDTSRVTRGETTLTVDSYRSLCRDANIILILNSPDFEKWLKYHFDKNRLPDFYNKNKGDIIKLFENDASIKRAYDNGGLRNIENIEYSEMYKLLDILIEYDNLFLDNF